MKLQDIPIETFFTYSNKLYFKCFVNNQNESICQLITIDNMRAKILENKDMYELETIDGHQNVILWNIKDCNFNIYKFSSEPHYLISDQNFKWYNFYNTTFKLNELIGNDGFSENFYVGSLNLSISDGVNPVCSSIVKNSSSGNDEKIKIAIYNKLFLEKYPKKFFENIVFFDNELLTYIKELKKEFIQNNDFNNQSLIFNISQVLDIIRFCLIKSDFFNTLINIRSIRNFFYGYIFETFILEQSSSKNNCKLQQQKESYYRTPVYFPEHTFNSLDIKELEFDYINTKEVVNWINSNLINGNNLKAQNLCKANMLTNNAVHKNHYDREGFEQWAIKDNEIDILYNTLKVYMDLLFATLKFKT